MAFLDTAERQKPAPAEPAPAVDLAAAHSAVARLTKEYPNLARASLSEARDRFDRASGAGSDQAMVELRRFAHNFAGQGASFNFPLITDIANTMRAYLKEKGRPDALDRTVVDAFFAAIEEALDRQLCGECGPEARAILDRLTDLAAA